MKSGIGKKNWMSIQTTFSKRRASGGGHGWAEKGDLHKAYD